ncbi:interleukin 25 [Cricetulus griseus]
MYQVAAFLAMMVGHAVSSQVHNDCSHWPSCCPSKEQDSLELPKLSTASVSPPEPLRDTSHTDSCKASNDGPLNRRSISPWSYELDRDLNRVPQDLYHARCLCTHCASLQRGSHMGLMGNSVPLYHNQTVFYRRPCHGQQESASSLVPQALTFIIFICFTASVSAYMAAALLEFFITLAFLFLYATQYYQRFDRLNWPCLDFLRCVSAIIIFLVVSFAAVTSREGAAIAAFVSPSLP